MISAEIRNFSVTLEITFPLAIALIDAKLGEVSRRLSDSQSGFPLAADQIRLKHSDILYGYELSASFFGGNATILRNAQQFRIALSNGATYEDSFIMYRAIETLGRISEEELPGLIGTITISAQCAFKQPDDAGNFFRRSNPPAVEATTIRTGFICLLPSTTSRHDARIVVEPSTMYSDAAFLFATTSLNVSDTTSSILQALFSEVTLAASWYGLEIALLHRNS